MADQNFNNIKPGMYVQNKDLSDHRADGFGRILEPDTHGNLYVEYELAGRCFPHAPSEIKTLEGKPHSLYPLPRTLPLGQFVFPNGDRILFNFFEEPITGFKSDGTKFQVSTDFDVTGWEYKEFFINQELSSERPFELNQAMIRSLGALLGCVDTSAVGEDREYRSGSSDAENSAQVLVGTFLIDTLEIDQVTFEGREPDQPKIYDHLQNDYNDCDCPRTIKELESWIERIGRQNILRLKILECSPYSFYVDVAYRTDRSHSNQDANHKSQNDSQGSKIVCQLCSLEKSRNTSV